MPRRRRRVVKRPVVKQEQKQIPVWDFNKPVGLEFYFADMYMEMVMTKARDSTRKAVEEEDMDEPGVDGRDIKIVMSHAEVSRSETVKALKSYDGDIVSAILELTGQGSLL